MSTDSSSWRRNRARAGGFGLNLFKLFNHWDRLSLGLFDYSVFRAVSRCANRNMRFTTVKLALMQRREISVVL